MVERRVSSLFVADSAEPGGPLGDYAIVTERDVMRALSAQGPPMLERPVGDLASKPLASIAGEAFLYRAVGRMHRLKIRHLAVRDDGGRLEGVISARDLLKLRAGAAIDLEDEIDAAGDAVEAGRRLVAAAGGHRPADCRGDRFHHRRRHHLGGIARHDAAAPRCWPNNRCSPTVSARRPVHTR
jgi:hypothetical protein